jgi:hypothetical protein
MMNRFFPVYSVSGMNVPFSGIKTPKAGVNRKFVVSPLGGGNVRNIQRLSTSARVAA